MKKLLIYMFLFFFVAVSVNAINEQKSITLNEEHSKEQFRFCNCNFFVTMVSTDNRKSATVKVEMENLDDSYVTVLFGRVYSEKELKKYRPSMRFDKGFGGDKGKRSVVSSKDIRGVMFFAPNDNKKFVSELQVENGDTYKCILPLYTGKYKRKRLPEDRKNKILFLQYDVLELEIKVDLEDKDFTRLERECNKLISDIRNQRFCTNTKHEPTAAVQEAPYKEKLSKLNTEIDSIISERKLFSNDSDFQRYATLEEKLNNIDFVEFDCGNHPAPIKITRDIHSCNYCKYTPAEIFNKLADYYTRLDIRKVTKKAIISDVQGLYNCKKWRNTKYESGIIDYYQRINNNF